MKSYLSRASGAAAIVAIGTQFGIDSIPAANALKIEANAYSSSTSKNAIGVKNKNINDSD